MNRFLPWVWSNGSIIRRENSFLPLSSFQNFIIGESGSKIPIFLLPGSGFPIFSEFVVFEVKIKIRIFAFFWRSGLETVKIVIATLVNAFTAARVSNEISGQVVPGFSTNILITRTSSNLCSITVKISPLIRKEKWKNRATENKFLFWPTSALYRNALTGSLPRMFLTKSHSSHAQRYISSILLYRYFSNASRSLPLHSIRISSNLCGVKILLLKFLL